MAEYLENPVVQGDDLLRLRCLVIKGETDQDLDPSLAAQSWREAQALAEKLGDAAWANRARGELGLVAFLQGDIGPSVIALGLAVKVAQANGDVSSLVRWLTLFGHRRRRDRRVRLLAIQAIVDAARRVPLLPRRRAIALLNPNR